MHKAIFTLFFGMSLLICCLGASAQSFMADTTVSSETGVTITLVLIAIGVVARGAWWYRGYSLLVEQRIQNLEEKIKKLKEAENDGE